MKWTLKPFGSPALILNQRITPNKLTNYLLKTRIASKSSRRRSLISYKSSASARVGSSPTKSI
jgi:hypothetical protein